MSTDNPRKALPLRKVLTLLDEGKEVWRSLPGHEGVYKVSSFGRVKSLERKIYKKDGSLHYTQRELIFSPTINHTSGYGYVSLIREGPTTVHTLVLRAFVGPPPPGCQCRHLDGNPGNNKLSNLRWGTPQENMDDKKRHGTNVGNRGRTKGFHYNQGESAGKAKLTESDVHSIRELFSPGQQNRPSFVEVSRKYGVHRSTIEGIVKRKSWRHI